MYKPFAAAAAIMLALSANAYAETNMKLAYFASPKNMVYADITVPWMNEINSKLAGKVKIDGFPGGALGRNPRAQVKLVQDGVIDIGFVVPSYTPGRFPDNEVMELPGVIRDSNESAIAIWRLYKRGLLRGFEDFHVFALMTTDTYRIHTTFPVKKLSDLKGKKLRAGGPVFGETLKAVGVVPVGMPITTVAENISKGVLDGSASDWNVAFSFRIIDVAKHHYMVPMGTVPIGYLVNKQTWDGLDAESKALLESTGGETFSRRYGKLNVPLQADLVKKAQGMDGHDFVFPDDTGMKAWRDATKPVIDAWIAKHPKGQELFDALTKELTKIRAES